MKVFVAQLNPIVGDLSHNSEKICASLERARKVGAQIVLFSEMALTGYPPEDLLLFPEFIKDAENALEQIVSKTKGLFVVLGCVRKNEEGEEKDLFNSAAIMSNGKLLGFKDKSLLPTYDVFDERRYFEPGKKQKVWRYKGCRIGVLICEDAWEHAKMPGLVKYRRDPIVELKKLSPDLLLIPNASPYYWGKKQLRIEIFKKSAETLNIPVIACNQVGANDQLVFDGNSFCMSEKGEVIQIAKSFEEDEMVVDLAEKQNSITIKTDDIGDLYNALVLGVQDYFKKQGFKKACIGLSGGVDSALVASIAVDALGADNVLAIFMPSRFSSKESLEDATILAQRLKIGLLNISIDEIFQKHLDTLEPFFKNRPFDTTEENLQARIRGMLLMAISNKFGYIVLSTGNKSEMAVGYATLYGDMCGGLGVLNDVLKGDVYKLSLWVNREKEIIPSRVLEKAPSAELKAEQKDSDSLPPYPVLDQVLEDYVEKHLSPEEIVERHSMDPKIVADLVERIHRAEYKRRQGPPGICVTKRAFTKGRFLPIVHKWR